MGTRVVLDTNIIVSGLGWHGASHDIVDFCLDRRYELLLSPDLLLEIERVLHYPKFQFLSPRILGYLVALTEVAEIVRPNFQLAVVEADPTDNRVLECARAGGAEVIVSGDRHLLDLAEFEKIPILRPRAFLDRFG
jgi:uncharacterized protein